MTLSQPSVSDDYPAILRAELTRYRRHRWPFEKAWTITMQDHPIPDEWEGRDRRATFLRAHFRAAYNRDSSMKGRFIPSEPDASAAVRALPRKFESPAPSSCRSGDGCSLPPVVGRFGPTFCVTHGRELEAMAMVPYEGFADRAVA